MDRAHAPVTAGDPARTLFYDGDCPLCERASAWLVARAPAPARRVAWQTLPPGPAEALREAGIARQLLVSRSGSTQPQGGVDGLVALLEGGSRDLLSRLLRARALRPLWRLCYPLVAHNRRVLAPPEACGRDACQPPPRLGLELAFAALCALWVLALAPLVGAVAFPAWGLGSRSAGAGWSLTFWGLLLSGQLLSAAAAPRGTRSLALRHGALASALCITPSLLILASGWLPRVLAVAVATIALGWGVRLLLLRHVRAQVRLGLGRRWVWTALLALWFALAIAIAHPA